MNKIGSIFLIFLLLPATSFSYDKNGRFTGNMLLRQCRLAIALSDKKRLSSTEVIEAYSCISYINGAIDGYNFSKVVTPRRLKKTKSEIKYIENKMEIFCNRPNLTKEQIIRVVIKHLEKYPKFLHLNGGAHVIGALTKAFPCKK